MNRIYRSLWSVATQSWQAVPETAKTAGKKSVKSAAGGVVASVALSFTLTGTANAQAPPAINQLPTGGTVSRGTATISQTATAQAAAMTVNQSSQRAVVNWSTFNLGQSASINFVQPNAQAVTLNRVNDSNPSQIFGRIQANGQVFLTNANGVYFSPTSSVDVGALTATTHSISDDNFMSGKYVFERNGATGKVVNEGNITAALSGYVALLAPEVQNSGVVVARAGTVAMAAGEMITLKVDDGGSLASLTATPSTIATLVENKHAVLAPDGQIILSAVALNKLQAGVIKNSGNLEANSLVNKGGKIYLEGDDITLDRNSKIEAKGPTGGGTVLVGGDWQGSGDMRQATKVVMQAGASIDASATDNGDGGKVVLWSDVRHTESLTSVEGRIEAKAAGNGKGGQVETSGHNLRVGNLAVNAQATTGQDGLWLIDPYDITISSAANANTALATNTFTASASGGVVNATSLQNALSANNITVSTTGSGTDTGNVTVSSDLSWSSAKTLTITAAGGITGTGNISMTGATGAGLIFNQAGNSTYSGNISGANATLTKQGAGTLSLSGNNSYGGGTTLTAGVLNLGSTNAIGTSGTISFGGGTLQSSSSNTTDYSARFGTTSQTYKIDTNGYDITWASNLGAGTLTKLGAGTLTLTGNDTGITGVTLSGGNLQLGDGGTTGALLSTNVLTVATSSNTTLIFNRNDAVTYGSLTVNGSGGLTQAGTGTLNFTGGSFNKNFSGTTYVKSGTLNYGNYSPNSVNKLVVDSGATFQYGSQPVTFGSLSGAGTIYTSSGSLLYAGSDNSNTEFSGNFLGNGTLGSGPLLAKQGTGTFIFSGTASTDFRGFDARGGTLQIGKGGTEGALGSNLSFSGGVFAINRSDTLTLPSFYGSGTLRQMGSGISVVGNSSGGFTGTTELLSGTLLLSPPSAGSALSTTGGSFVFGGGTLKFSATDTTDYSARFSTAANQAYKLDTNGQTVTLATALTSTGGSLTKMGSGTLILAKDNTYDGGTTINAGGTLQLGAPGNALAGSGSTGSLGSGPVVDNGTLSINRTNAYSLTNAISGAGELTQAGTATTTLSGNNGSFTGGININAGALTAGSANAFGSSGTISFGGGYLTYTNGFTTDYSGRFNTANGQAYKINTNGLDVTLASSLGGIGNSLTKAGLGTLTLSGNNTYTGSTTLSAGTLKADSATAFGASNITESSGAVVDLNGQTMTNTTGGLALNGTGITSGGALINSSSAAATYPGLVTLGASTTITAGTGSIALTNTGTISGNTFGLTLDGAAGGSIAGILGTTSGTLNKAGSGSWTLSGANTYSGTTTVSNGTLILSGTNTSTGAITISAGTLVVDGSGSLGSGAYSGSISNSGTFKYSSSAAQTLSNVISGSGTLTKDTSSTSTLTLTALNNYTGPTNIYAGTLKISGSGTLGSAGGLYGGNITNNGTLQHSSSATQTFSGVISGSGNIVKDTGTNTLTLTGVNTYTGDTTISAGTLTIGGSGSLGSGTYAGTINDNGTFIFASSATQTLNGNITGTGALTKSTGTGVLTLNGNDTYSGATTISAGTVKAGSTTSLGTGAISVTTGGALDLNGQTMDNTTGNLTLSGTGVSSSGALLNSSATSATYSGLMSLTGNSSILAGTGSIALPNTGTISGAFGLTLGGAAGGSLSGILGMGTGGLTKQDASTWTLSGTHTYTGNTTISGGTLVITSAGALGSGSYGGTISNSGTFQFSSSAAQTLSGVISGSGSLTKDTSATSTLTLTGVNTYTGNTNINAGTLVIGGTGVLSSTATSGLYAGNISNSGTLKFTSSASETLSGVVSGSGDLIKEGSSTLTLTGVNTYTGNTTISAGILKIGGSGSLGSGSYSGTINDNGTFQFASSANQTLSGRITGTGGLTKDTSTTSTLTISGTNNDYGGLTTVGGGTLALGANNALSTSTVLHGTAANNTYLDLNGYSQTVANFYADSYAWTLKLGSGTLTVGNSTASVSTPVQLSSTTGGSLTKIGSGSIAFTVAQLYNGTTQIDNGSLVFAANTATSPLNIVQVNSSGTLAPSVQSAGQRLYINSLSGSGTIRADGPRTISLGGDNSDSTFSGTISNTAAGSGLAVEKNGTGKFTNTGTVSNSGGGIFLGYTIKGGTVQVGDGTVAGAINYGSDVVLSNNSTFILNASGASTISKAITGTGTLKIAGGNWTINNATNALPVGCPCVAIDLAAGTSLDMGSGNPRYVSLLSGTGEVKLSTTTSTDKLYLVNSTTDYSFAGLISGTGGISKLGTNTVSLTANNTFSGGVVLSAGTLKAGSSSAFGTGAITEASGAVLDLNGQNLSTAGALSISGTGINSSGALINSNSTAATYGGLLTLTSASSIVGGAGSISLTNSGTIIGSFALTLDGSSGGSIASILGLSNPAGTLTKQGTGTWSLTGANTYTSTTTISAGTLQVGSLTNSTAKLGTGAITNNGNLVFYRSGGLTLSAMAPSATAITGTGNVTLQGTGAVTVDRSITLTGANSAIYVEAGVNSAANTSLVSDVTLTNTITTSNTGTIAILEGSPTATASTGSTANLSLKMAGATGSIQYKTYNASLASLNNTVVAGTRNFYYRLQPSLTVSGATITASKTYDGNTTAVNAVVSGGTASSATDGDAMSFTATGATYDTATAGINKSMTVAVTTASTNAGWVVKGYSGTMSATTYAGTINKAPLTITALNDARFVTESDTAGYAGVTDSGFVNSESTSNLGGALTLARSNRDNNAAGNYTLTPGGWTSTNYDITYRTGTYTIVPANQLLVRVADTSAVYGTTPSYRITSAKYVMPNNSLIDLTSQLTYSGGTYSLNDGASGQALFTLGVSNGTYSGSGNLNVGVWNTAAMGASTTSPNFSNVLTVVGTQTVTPRQLTVAATAANKAYDGTTTATLASMTDNRLTGDALTVTQTSATFADKNAGAAQTVTISGISASGLDAGNYFAPVSTLTTTGTITQKALTLAGLTVNSKTYDGSTQATMSSLGTLTGVVGIEDVHVDNASASSTFTDKNVGTGKTVNVTGLSLTGADIANYTLGSTVTTTADITAKALTVTGTSVADKIYDATTTATLSSGTLSGVASGDTVTLTQAGNFVDKNYSASPKTVTAADTISGADASNYTLTQPTGLTASISRADLSISGLTAVDRAYNATLVASLTGTPTITPLLTDTVSIVGSPTALFTTKDVGTGKTVTVTGYTFTGADSNNYNPIQPTGLTASISKASLTVSGVSATDKVYDATTTATLTGTPTVTALLTDSVSIAGPTTGTFADKNASASPIAITTAYTLAGTDAGNYNIVQPSGLSAYITPKALSMEGLSAPSSKTYDGTTTATVLGNASLKTASVPGAGNSTDGKPYAGDLLTLSGSPVGTYNSKDVTTASSIAFTGISMSGPSAGNYTLSSYAPYAATITPKDLTVKANNDANFFAIPTDTVGFNGVTYLGFVTGESAANLSFASGTAPTITSSLASNLRITPGTYTNVLTPSGINSGNYHPVYQSGDFTVIPADTLLIRAANSTVAYGTSASIGTPTASYYSTTYGLVGSLNVTRSGDAFNVTDITHGGSATVTLAPITTLAQMSQSGNAGVGTYNIGASSVTNLVGTNFSNTVTVAGTQTVTPKALTITATASNKVYDASNAATVSLSSSDAVTGDLISYDKTAATFSDANAALAKTVTARGLTLSGTDAGNYSLQNTSTTTTADITPKLVQLTATKTYDGTTSLATNQVTITTGVGSETLTYSGATLASKNVASNATNTVDSITLLNGTGANAGLASNYTFTTTRGANNSATVNPASLTLAPVTDTKVYDGTQSSSQAVLVNNSSGSSDVVSAQQEFASKDVMGAGLSTLQIKAGYTIKDSSNADMSGNYVVTSTATAAGTITPADIVVSGVSAANKTYDATRNASLVGSATVNAFSGDVVTVSGTGTGLFADKNAGTAKAVTVSGYTLSGTDAGNYNVVQPTGLTADVTKADLTVSGITANNKVYDATPNATLAGTASVSALASDVVTVSGTGTGLFADKNAGTAKAVTVSGFTLSGTDAGNYNVVQPTGLTADITKAPLTVTADDAAKLFDNATPALTVALSGFVGGETLATSGVTGTGTATTTATLNTTAGTAVITPTVGTLAASNYDFTNFVNGTLTINAISSLNNNEVVQLIGSQLSVLSSAQMAGFTATQLQVFSAQQLGSLSSTQLLGMTASQLGSLNSTQLQGIKPAQVALLNASQISGVTADQLASFSTSQLLALSASQIATLLPAQLSSLTPAQISLLTGDAAASLSPQQILSLSPEQIAAVSLTQVAALSVSELGALSDAQLQALTPLQLASIAPDHFAAFTPQQIMAMSITQVQNLSPEQLSTFTPAQVASISAAELAYFDARQLAAIGIYPAAETPKTESVAESNFEAAIPVMTAIASPAASAASAVVPSAPTTALPVASTATVNTTSTAPRTGLLAITILHSTEAKPTTAGVAFEQDADTVSLRVTAAPAVPPLADKVVFTDKLTTFLVAAPNGEMVEFEGTLVNNRIIIVAPSVAAKRVARAEMNLVLAAAVTSLGKENRVMLAKIDGIVLDLR